MYLNTTKLLFTPLQTQLIEKLSWQHNTGIRNDRFEKI